MSRIYKNAAAGAVSGPPDQGTICSVSVTNTAGALAEVVLTDGDGQEIARIECPNNESVQWTYSGVDYFGGLTAAGTGATTILFIEVD